MNEGQNRKNLDNKNNFFVPTGVTDTFSTSKRGKPLCCSKWPKISGLKMSVIERFHCIGKDPYKPLALSVLPTLANGYNYLVVRAHRR